MAIKKEIEIGNSGLTCEYWKITAIDLRGLSGEVRLSGYKNKDCRDNNKEPFFNKMVTTEYTIEEMNKENNNIIKDSYEQIKKLEEFIGSEDV